MGDVRSQVARSTEKEIGSGKGVVRLVLLIRLRRPAVLTRTQGIPVARSGDYAGTTGHGVVRSRPGTTNFMLGSLGSFSPASRGSS